MWERKCRTCCCTLCAVPVGVCWRVHHLWHLRRLQFTVITGMLPPSDADLVVAVWPCVGACRSVWHRPGRRGVAQAAEERSQVSRQPRPRKVGQVSAQWMGWGPGHHEWAWGAGWQCPLHLRTQVLLVELDLPGTLLT
jgi:hypothetical protein